MAEVIAEAVEIVRGLAEARRLQLVVEPPDAKLTVDLDRMRVRQVLLNLLTNAMRSTEAGWVRVSTTLCATEITVTVADSGRGIAPEKLARAFEAFDRLDEEQLSKGSGLGLAVSKKFVNLHEGRMWIESEVGARHRGQLYAPVADRQGAPAAGNAAPFAAPASGCRAADSVGSQRRSTHAGAAASPYRQLRLCAGRERCRRMPTHDRGFPQRRPGRCGERGPVG